MAKAYKIMHESESRIQESVQANLHVGKKVRVLQESWEERLRGQNVQDGAPVTWHIRPLRGIRGQGRRGQKGKQRGGETLCLSGLVSFTF